MPKINNEPVLINDTLYDLANGLGTVSATTEKTIEVIFSNGRRMTFNQHGQINGVRRLFWQYPIFLDPPKSITQWQKTLDTMTSIFNLIKSYKA